jgi:hypothetical protein
LKVSILAVFGMALHRFVAWSGCPGCLFLLRLRWFCLIGHLLRCQHGTAMDGQWVQNWVLVVALLAPCPRLVVC